MIQHPAVRLGCPLKRRQIVCLRMSVWPGNITGRKHQHLIQCLLYLQFLYHSSCTTRTISLPPLWMASKFRYLVAMLQQVHTALGQLLQGQQPQLPSLGSIPSQQSAPLPAPGTGLPFAVPKVSRTEKKCQFCQRVFWAPETFRRHLKTHLGTQHNVCPNQGCGRKLSSKRSLDLHLTTCGVPKNIFCPKKNCKSRFATQQALQHHLGNHQILKKADRKCPGCTKDDFTKEKSKKDHWRYCPGNPNRIGPFYCPVPGCHRGTGSDKPFERTRNLNTHLRVAHGHDPKHTKE